MRDKIAIRKGKISDSRTLLKLLNSVPELQSSEESNTYTLAWVRNALADKKRNLVLVANKDNHIIGFLIAEIWVKKRYSFINDIFIDKKYRKKGIATQLMKSYETICKKLKLRTIIGLVLTTNKKMHNLKEKLGYKRGNIFYLYEKKL